MKTENKTFPKPIPRLVVERTAVDRHFQPEWEADTCEDCGKKIGCNDPSPCWDCWNELRAVMMNSHTT